MIAQKCDICLGYWVELSQGVQLQTGDRYSDELPIDICSRCCKTLNIKPSSFGGKFRSKLTALLTICLVKRQKVTSEQSIPFGVVQDMSDTIPPPYPHAPPYVDPKVTGADALLAVSKSIDRMTDKLTKVIAVIQGLNPIQKTPQVETKKQKGTPMNVLTDQQGDYSGPVILPMGNPGTNAKGPTGTPG